MAIPPPWEITILASSYFDAVFRVLNAAASETEALPFDLYAARPPAVDPPADAILLETLLRLLRDPNDQLAWRRVVHLTPSLGDARLTRLLTAGRSVYRANIEDVASSDDVVARSLDAATQAIARGTDNISESVRRFADRLGLVSLDWAVVDQLLDDGSLAGDPAEILASLRETIDPVREVHPEDIPNGIAVRTIHNAKGLESPVVFVVAAIPQAFARDPADGLRRAFVAATRSADQLYVSAPRVLRARSGSYEHVARGRAGGLASLFLLAASQLGIQITQL